MTTQSQKHNLRIFIFLLMSGCLTLIPSCSSQGANSGFSSNGGPKPVSRPALSNGSVTSCGIIRSSGTYTLRNDVSGPGTCFMVAANEVTIDLNGKSITYDNAPPIPIANGSFESADLTGWDLSGAPTARRTAGDYLSRTVYAGSYALKIPAPLTQNHTIVTANSYKLAANMPYSASVMMWEPYDVASAANADIHMAISIIKASDNRVLATADLRSVEQNYTTRGFQYVPVVYTPPVDTDVKIQLAITGGRTVTDSGQTPFGAFYFDDVRIQQTSSIGIQFGGTNIQHGISNAWARQGSVVSTKGGKGKIIQGQNHGDFSHAIIIGSVPSDPHNYVVDNQEITVYGNSARAIYITNAANGIISNNLIHGHNDTIKTRDHYDGALIYVDRGDPATGVAGKIYDNTITNGIQTGIYVVSSPSATMLTEIYNNDITLQSKYTNDFAIVSLRDYGSNIYNNTIRCGSGNNTCRGIYLSADGGAIHDNTIDVHYDKNNQEYGGCGGYAYGIQLEDGAKNTEVYNNTVTANADECGSVAFRYYGPNTTNTLNNNVHNNIFNALAKTGSSQIASVVAILETYAQHLSITNNTLLTNSNWLNLGESIVEDASRSLVLDHNTYTLSYPKAEFYHPLISSTYVGGEEAGKNAPRNVALSHNIYSDPTVKSDLSTAKFMSYYSSYQVDPYAYNILVTQ